MLIADNGVIIRTPIDQISKLSRASQGVKIMKLRDGSHIVSVALTEKAPPEPELDENGNPIAEPNNAETANADNMDISTTTEE